MTITNDGTLETLGDGRRRMRFERRVRHPIDRVWRAITQPDEIEAWLARAEIDLRPDGRIYLEWLNTDEHGQRYEGAELTGTITRLEPPRLIEYSSDAHGLLTWELSEAGDETDLVFTCVVELPDDQALDNLSGWHVHLDFLEGWLDRGTRIDWQNWPREQWAAIHEAYEASMRPIS
jgi:uncharacterized protein YndB with AHSA1/START domain